MPAYLVNLKEKSFVDPIFGPIRFVPTEAPIVHGKPGRVEYDTRIVDGNPVIKRIKEEPTEAARFMVGLYVKRQPRWEVDDVLSVVKEVALSRGADPAASFIVQRGLFQATEGDRVIDEEDSVQIVIINVGEPSDEFQPRMIELAEVLAWRLSQDSVILDFQLNGLIQETLFIAAAE